MTAEIDIDSIGEDVPMLEGIRTTRGIRRLKPDPVPIELVRKVCEAGTFAPSGGNRQPWFFIAVNEPEKIKHIAGLYCDTFRQYIVPAKAAAEKPGARYVQFAEIGVEPDGDEIGQGGRDMHPVTKRADAGADRDFGPGSGRDRSQRE